ncbi:hypothetical protein ONZ45_g9087 [Pleurotus djamor]|nr:hypothetical protein ONZ45_g9087 [Pleurotus djamor]
MRVLLMSSFLEGQALAWFDHVVDGNRSHREWSFNNAVVALFDRFIPWKAVCDAGDLFDGTRYNPKFGVRGFYELLHLRGARMVYPPGRTTFVDKFTKGIPSNVFQRLRERTIVDLHSLTLDRLLKEAVTAEEIEINLSRIKANKQC